MVSPLTVIWDNVRTPIEFLGDLLSQRLQLHPLAEIWLNDARDRLTSGGRKASSAQGFAVDLCNRIYRSMTQRVTA
jgi:hypothetical protein